MVEFIRLWCDLIDFLTEDAGFASLELRAADPGLRVALHLPCTQRNVLRNAARIAPLLQRIPQLALTLLPATGCCGAAGVQMLSDPVRADAFRAPLLDALATADATTLCSSNVGCRMHLARGMDSRRVTRDEKLKSIYNTDKVKSSLSKVPFTLHHGDLYFANITLVSCKFCNPNFNSTYY